MNSRTAAHCAGRMTTREEGSAEGDQNIEGSFHDSVSDTLSHTTADDEPANWEDWDEACDSATFVCLFCPSAFKSRKHTLDHCTDAHNFDLEFTKSAWGRQIHP